MQLRLEELEQGVAALPKDQLAQFRRWYEAFDTEAWDAQIEQDVKLGRLDAIAEQAIHQYKAGKAKPL